jgi:hypothetical protein
MVGLPGNGGAIRVAKDGQMLVAVGGVGADRYGSTNDGRRLAFDRRFGLGAGDCEREPDGQ